MGPPRPFVRSACFIFNPFLKLILPKAPDAADFEAGELTLTRKARDSEGVNPEHLGDLVGRKGLELLHVQCLPVGSTDYNRANRPCEERT